MKDFAKSIKVGNALTKGQVLYKREDKTFVYGGEVNGTHIVYRQPDGKAFSFSSEDQVKEFIKDIPARYQAWKTGNSKVGNAYKPDVSKTPADYERMIKQAKTADELGEMNDDIEYDIKEYEIAIDDCNMRIKDYQRMISSLRMVQRNAKDAQNKMK